MKYNWIENTFIDQERLGLEGTSPLHHLTNLELSTWDIYYYGTKTERTKGQAIQENIRLKQRRWSNT